MGGTEGPGIFLPGHEGSLLFFANSASALPSPDLNSVTRLQRGHCWQFRNPIKRSFASQQVTRDESDKLAWGGRNFLSSFKGVLRQVPGRLPFTVDLAESLVTFHSNAEGHQC